MPDQQLRLVIFEDNADNYEAVRKHLQPIVERLGGRLDPFQSGKELRTYSPGQITALVGDKLLKPNPATLVLIDWDLTQYVEPVTRELVRGQCDEHGIPACVYHAAKGPHEEARRLLKWNESHIVIESTASFGDIARKAGSIFEGFDAIADAMGQGDLGEALHKVMDPPRSATPHIDRYARGRQKAIEVADVDNKALRNRLAATNIGYWIYNRLLQFPGVLLNPVAAASYLDIDPSDFAKPEVQEYFDSARYNGPFHQTGPYWWASELDEVRARATPARASDIITARAMLEAKRINVNPARCVHDGKDPAGYYCILRRAPVCDEHSVSPSWLPAGADRSRIEIDQFEQLAPWLGL